MEVNDQLHAVAALTQGKELRYPFDRRLGGPQSRSGRGGEDRIILATAENRTLFIQSVAQSLY
jgi:hypothetical protein